MSDEKFEEFLQRDAKAYNEPPTEVPREEMFAAIVAGRRAGAGAHVRTARGPHLTRFAWIGMAATLVIGVAIGRFALTKQAASSVALRHADASASLRHSDASASLTPMDPNGGASYAQAATAQLARAEALLSAYDASGANAGVDKQLSTWARDILSNTRLLLDSPAADDPSRRRLLQDLELVLVQMVQRSPAAGEAEERSHIDRSMERTQVLPRLRSALPAGRNNGI
jgi:hypothetical protein